LRGINYPTEDDIIQAVVKAHILVQSADIAPGVGFEACEYLVTLYADARRDCPWKCSSGLKACLCTASVARSMVARLGK
jgi:hypothetical protein